MGGSKRANVYAKLLECGVVICYKEREKPMKLVGEMKVLGEVKGKDVVIIDDMVDTAGTLCKAADLMIKNGANSVRAYCTHAILSGSAYINLIVLKLQSWLLQIQYQKIHQSKKVREITVAKFLANTIKLLLKIDQLVKLGKAIINKY